MFARFGTLAARESVVHALDRVVPLSPIFSQNPLSSRNRPPVCIPGIILPADDKINGGLYNLRYSLYNDVGMSRPRLRRRTQCILFTDHVTANGPSCGLTLVPFFILVACPCTFREHFPKPLFVDPILISIYSSIYSVANPTVIKNEYDR